MESPKLSDWTPEQVAQARLWVQAWRDAGPELERLRRQELRGLGPGGALSLLCGEADYSVPPRAPKPGSGLVDQQAWFMRVARRA